MDYLLTISVFIFGLVIGSFLNVCIYRLPKKESIVFPSSHCPFCKKPIKWYDNIPVLSYLLLKGKCRSCGKRISPIYPLVEILTASLLTGVFLKYGFSFDFIFYSILVCFLIVVSFIDINELMVPVKLCYFTMVAGFILSPFSHSVSFVDSILGASFGAGVILFIIETYYVFRGKEGMGYGDANILATIGAFIGWKKILLVLMVASIVGAVIGIFILLLTDKDSETPLPFGPFLAIGAYVVILFGDAILRFYFR